VLVGVAPTREKGLAREMKETASLLVTCWKETCEWRERTSCKSDRGPPLSGSY